MKFAVAAAEVMKEKDQEEKQTNRLGNLCSASGLLLSVVCCLALIHAEIRIQEQHELISHSVRSCDQLETKILRKVQKNYARLQHDGERNNKRYARYTGGKFYSCSARHFQDIHNCVCRRLSFSSVLEPLIINW